MSSAVNELVDQVSPGYVAVATWLAATHHPADSVQQRRAITGHRLRWFQKTAGTWRDRYRDTRPLSETVQAILEQHLPLSAG
jgi:hypothetical protein